MSAWMNVLAYCSPFYDLTIKMLSLFAYFVIILGILQIVSWSLVDSAVEFTVKWAYFSSSQG